MINNLKNPNKLCYMSAKVLWHTLSLVRLPQPGPNHTNSEQAQVQVAVCFSHRFVLSVLHVKMEKYGTHNETASFFLETWKSFRVFYTL